VSVSDQSADDQPQVDKEEYDVEREQGRVVPHVGEGELMMTVSRQIKQICQYLSFLRFRGN